MDCKEQLDSLLTSIEAYPCSSITTSTPLQFSQKVVHEGDLNIPAGGAVVVSFRNKSAVVNIQTDTSLAGRSHKVSIEWEVDNADSDTLTTYYNQLIDCKSLIIKSYSGVSSYIPATPDAYQFEAEQKGDAFQCKISIHNLPGAVRIIP